MSSYKLTLLNRLLDATRDCQTQYSTKKEIMTETSSCVSCLCRQFEDVLSHGIKQRPIVSGIATIQNVTGLQLVDHDNVFWHCVQKHLSKHEVERFNNLYHITTDIGRGRSWLRSSLNEHSLDRVLQMLLSDDVGLKSQYSSDAFMLDDEKASLLPQIAAGLKSVMFSVKIDDPALNSFPQTSVGSTGHKRVDSGGTGFSLPSLAQVGNLLGHEVAMEDFPQAAIQSGSTSKSERSHKKRKKKARTKIINFGQGGGVSERPSSFSSVDDPTSPQSSSYTKGFFNLTSNRSSSIRSEEEDTPTQRSRESSQPLDIPIQDDDIYSNSLKIDQADNVVTKDDELSVSVQSLERSNALEDQTNVLSMKGNSDSKLTDFDDDIYKQTLDEEKIDSDAVSPDTAKISSQKTTRVQRSNPFSGMENTNTNNLNPSLAESFSETKIADKLESSCQLRFDSGSDISSLNESTEVDGKSIVSTSSSNQFEVNQNVNSDTWSINSANVFTPLNDTDSIASSSGSLPNTLMHNHLTFSAARGSYSPRNSSPSSLPTEDKVEGKSSDLQKALVVLLQRKDELAEENKAIKELLEAEKIHSGALREENEVLKQQVERLEHSTKVDANKQLRENDVLRNQLKKYVGAVHALQHGKVAGVSQDGIPGIGEEDTTAETSTEQEQSEEAKVYEQKLIEVTEMHGELMEFTESLHTRFLSALSLIHKMHDELVALRGPIPTDDVIKAIEADKARDNISSLPTMTRALVNVWVPSAFMQGSGPESHHVYQVYICVGEDEWNVYRRYSDFHTLHNTLCKSYPEIQTFGFPPKKGIGNRNSKFVEERRKAFQKYLRLVMHNIFQNNTQLKANPTKATLLHILPFFCDAGDQCRVIVGKHKK